MLEGQTVWITGPVRPDSDRLGLRLAVAGASLFYSPVIRILPPASWNELDRVLCTKDKHRGWVFLSQHGVQAVLNRANSLGQEVGADFEDSLEFFAIGQGTQAEWQRLAGKGCLIPEESNSLGIAGLLSKHRDCAPFLVFRGNRGSRVLPDQLTSMGIPFEQVIAYRSVDIESADSELVQQMQNGQIDWVTVTSSAIARALVHLYGDALNRTRLASISPTTSSVLTELGYSPAVEAKSYDFDGLVEAIVDRSREN